MSKFNHYPVVKNIRIPSYMCEYVRNVLQEAFGCRMWTQVSRKTEYEVDEFIVYGDDFVGKFSYYHDERKFIPYKDRERTVTGNITSSRSDVDTVLDTIKTTFRSKGIDMGEVSVHS